MDAPPELQPARKPTIVFAICMIAAGIVLFLGNLGLFPIHRVWDLWPLVFTFLGFGRLAGQRTPGRLLMGAAFVLLGITATLFTAGVFQLRFHDDSWFISLVLIAVGVSGLAKVLDGERWHFGDPRYSNKWACRRQRRLAKGYWKGRDVAFESTAAGRDSYNDTDPFLNHRAMMGHIKRSVQSQNFEGGRLTSILGSIEIDLRRAKMPEGKKSAQLDLEVVMGHIALRVPDSWRVIWNGDNMLGNFEDKTIPPNTGANAPELIVTGSCTMGSIEIES